MSLSGSVSFYVLYHGTDVDSALDILNNGLSAERLISIQGVRPVQLGLGWYAALDSEVAWFFASLAPGNIGRGYTVIEMEIIRNDLNYLEDLNLAIKSAVKNVPFQAEQYWFDISSFDYLNNHAAFRPIRRS